MSLGNQQYFEDVQPVYTNGTTAEVVGDPRFVAVPTGAVKASGLALAGVVTTLLGIWGGIIPFIGPSFSYSADGSAAWKMTSAHLWLAVIPGAVAFVCGLVMLLVAPRTVTGSGRGALGLAGLFAVLAGAWFVVGDLAWPVVTTATGYFVAAAPLRELGYQVGYGLGPGLLIVLGGAFALGWIARHQVVSTAVQRRGAHSVVTNPAARRRTAVSDETVVNGAPAAGPYGGPTVVTEQPVVTQQPVADQPVVTQQPVAQPTIAQQRVVERPPVIND